MLGSTNRTRLELTSNNEFIARVPRNDLIGKQAQKVRAAIMGHLHPDTQTPWGVREILHISKDMFQKWYIRSQDWRTEQYYEQCRSEALRLQALDEYYYKRATTTKKLADLTDAEWDMLDIWDAYLLAPELEKIPFDRHKDFVKQIRDRIRAEQ